MKMQRDNDLKVLSKLENIQVKLPEIGSKIAQGPVEDSIDEDTHDPTNGRSSLMANGLDAALESEDDEKIYRDTFEAMEEMGVKDYIEKLGSTKSMLALADQEIKKTQEVIHTLTKDNKKISKILSEQEKYLDLKPELSATVTTSNGGKPKEIHRVVQKIERNASGKKQLQKLQKEIADKRNTGPMAKQAANTVKVKATRKH